MKTLRKLFRFKISIFLQIKRNMLERLITQYQTAQQNINTNRQLWRDSIKSRLRETLHQIVATYPIDWVVDENNAMENGEAFSLKFHTRPSGMHDKIQMKNISRVGGSLNFLQLFNGELQVYVRHPQIEGIYKKDPEIKHLDFVIPDELTVEKIKSFVEDFMQEIIKFEQIERKTIGYFNV